MKIKAAMPQFLDGDLLLFKGRSPISLFIRFWTTSPYAHVGVVVWHEGSPHFVEARLGHLVTMRPVEDALSWSDCPDWYRIDPSFHMLGDGSVVERGIDRAAVAIRAKSFVGKKYASFWQFVRSFSSLTSRILDAIGFRSDVDPCGVHCSDLSLECLKFGGLQWSDSIDSCRSTPGDIATLPGAKKIARLCK